MLSRQMVGSVISRSQLPIKKLTQRRSYASSPEESSSRVPWLVGGVCASAITGYMIFVPAEQKQQAKEQVQHVKEKTKQQIVDHQKIKELDESRKPKNNVDKDSEAGHKEVSEKNEHKIRQGVFSHKQFDNQDTRHTSNPANDFEEIKQKE